MHVRIRIAVASFTIAQLVIFLLAGCNSKTEDARPGSEVIEQTYKVEPNASVRIANTRGSVSIRGTDTSEVRMRAVKKTSAAAQLNDISVNVTAEPGDVSIKTSLLRQKKMPSLSSTTAVEYTLSVPRNARIARLDVDDGDVSIEAIENADIRANVVNGHLEIRNCCGDLKVAVANGALNLLYSRCEGPYFSADAQVLNGDAHISVARGASLRVRAETVNGKITNNIAPAVELNGQPSRKVDIPLGSGRRCDLTVRVTSGDITIVAAEPGESSAP